MAKKTATESILREKPGKSPKFKIKADERFKSLKSISIISVVLVIAICIVGNLILDLTLDKKLTFDATSVKQNSVSSITESYLRNLNKKVEIVGLFDRNETAIDWSSYFLPIMDDYEAKSGGMIDLKYIDPDVDPFILSQLDPENLYGLQKYTYVVKCGDLLRVVYPLNCFEFDQEMQYYYGALMPTKNLIEKEVTGSLVYVTSERPLHAYYLSGHTLPSHKSLDKLLLTLGIVSSEIDLKSEQATIPEDCELLIILEPQSDITLSEKELLKTYLDNAGKILLVNDFNTNKTVDFTNLNEVAHRMGVSLESGVIHENDANYLYNASDVYHSIAKTDSKYAEYITVPDSYTIDNCRYLAYFRDKSEKVYVSPLIVTSSIASVDFEESRIDSDVSAGTYPVVLQCVDATHESDPSCMIVIGTNTFTSDSYYSENSLSDNNAVFMQVMLGNICPITTNILVPEKTVPSYVLSKPLSSSSATMWSIVVMTIIPIGCLICGVYTYNKRRHL